MRKLAQFVARLYPKAWRERYGAEFDWLLDDLTLSWRDVLDVLKGGLRMRMTRSKVALVTAAFGLFGAIACGLIGLAIPKRFESTELMHVQEWSPSPVLAAGAVEELASLAFSPEDLKQIIKRYDLYPEDRAKRPLDEILKRMRDDIHIAPYSGTTFRVSFAYPDRHKAQQVTIRLMERLNEAEFAERFGPDGLKSAGVMANVGPSKQVGIRRVD